MEKLLAEWSNLEPGVVTCDAEHGNAWRISISSFLDRELIFWLSDSKHTEPSELAFIQFGVQEAIAFRGWDWEASGCLTPEKEFSYSGCITIFSESWPEQFFDFGDNPAEALLGAYLEALKSSSGEKAIASQPEEDTEVVP
jgi:hypothetical protein